MSWAIEPMIAAKVDIYGRKQKAVLVKMTRMAVRVAESNAGLVLRLGWAITLGRFKCSYMNRLMTYDTLAPCARGHR